MFEKLTTIHALNLSKILKWNPKDIHELLNKPNLNKEDIHHFYTNKLKMKQISTPPNHLCSVCDLTMHEKLLTNIEGTYKYTHNKYNSTTYYMCPLCLYLCAHNKTYANLASSINTYDPHGIIECRPSTNHSTNWVIVHPHLLNHNHAIIKCGCDYGCYRCNIDPRFCFENN